MKVGSCMLALIGWCALTPWSPAQAATPASEAEQQLRKLEREWIAAEINRDAAALERILDDRFVGTFGVGKPLGKQQFIRALVGTDEDRIVSEDLSDETFVVAGDTAVVAEIDTVHSVRA
ncbi:MAG TPA: nuclear transport factor 2 family protein, partial [Steroidobacteraceae bacterium]|nr:nuclear transport factor 2 family protein [Steroidobacteraceae bacterium]